MRIERGCTVPRKVFERRRDAAGLESACKRAANARDEFAVEVPNARVPITVFRASSARSSTGAKSSVQPIAAQVVRKRLLRLPRPAACRRRAPSAIIAGIGSTPVRKRMIRPPS